ncbi:unnamed protein product [Cercospora beticola]|nr:unnamed protein product [Cercospora beticola]
MHDAGASAGLQSAFRKPRVGYELVSGAQHIEKAKWSYHGRYCSSRVISSPSERLLVVFIRRVTAPRLILDVAVVFTGLVLAPELALQTLASIFSAGVRPLRFVE